MPKNQTSFKPGIVTNPNGRPPKEWTMSGLIREALEIKNEMGIPKSVTIAQKLTDLADRGDITAIKEINNRIDGMPQQTVDHEGVLELRLTNVDDV